MSLVVLLLSFVFGLLAAWFAGRQLVAALFRFRPLDEETEWSALLSSVLGTLAWVIPMTLLGFTLFSVLLKGGPLPVWQGSESQQNLLLGLVLLGGLLQVLLAQRVSVTGAGSVGGQCLVVDRPLLGVSLRLTRQEIEGLELYRTFFNPRARRVCVKLVGGEKISLALGEESLAELRACLDLR